MVPSCLCLLLLDAFQHHLLPIITCVLSSEGATSKVPEAAGAASAANRFREREAAEAEGSRGEPGGKAQEDPGNERPGGLQQGHQWQPVYVYYQSFTN